MKNITKGILIATTTLLIASCQTESIEDVNTSENLTTSVLQVNNQIPNPALDNKNEGIYLGIVAHKFSQERGKIWVNYGNNGYSAQIELLDGASISLKGKMIKTTKHSAYSFTSVNASFIASVIDQKLTIENLIIDQKPFFSETVKDKSFARAVAFTGTFGEGIPTGTTPVFNGTWNLISTGTVLAQGGFIPTGETIASTVVTFSSGTMYTDTSFDTFTGCIGSNAEPVMLQLNGENLVFAGVQTSNFNGTANWSLIGNSDGNYTDNTSCQLIPSGTFSWTNGTTGTTRAGYILID